MASLAELQAEFDRRQRAQPQAAQQPVQQHAPSNLQALEAEFVRRQSAQQPEAQDDGIRRIDSSSVDSDSTGVQQEKVLGDVSLEEVDKALLSVPGVPSLAEFAAGSNRSVAGFLDFLGPDNINAVLELAGSEKRVPTFSGAIASKGGFVEDGLQQKILSTAGEIAPAALGVGQTLRSLASKLPQAVAGETAGTGVVRQLGQTTAKQDIIGASAAGAGQEAGREVAGEKGALIGGVLAPVALAAIPLNAARGAAAKLLKKSAPSTNQLKEAARGVYKSLDESGVSVSSKSFNNLADDIAATLRKEGSDIDLTPKAVGVVNRLQTEKGVEKTLTELDTLRKVARTAAESIDKSESRLGVIAVNKIDEFLDDVGVEITQGKEAGQAFRSARDLWQRARKSEVLEQAIKNAENQASGFENGIRTQFRQVLKRIDTGKLKGYTEKERDAIKRVVQGTKAGNVAKFLGKFGVLDGVTSRSLTTLGGIGVASAAGGTGAAVAVPVIGQVSGALAQRLTLNNARMAQSIIKAGKKALPITKIYIQNTPKAQQSPSELAELLLANKVPVNNINLKSAPPLLSSAALIASVAKLNDTKEDE